MNELPPTTRQRSRSHRSSGAPFSRDNQTTRGTARRNSRDSARDRDTDHLRDLTHERPPDPQPTHNWAAPPTLRREQTELVVDAIFSAHSDGLMVILRQSSSTTPPPRTATVSQNTFTFPPPLPPPLSRPSRSDDSTRSSGSSSSEGRYSAH